MRTYLLEKSRVVFQVNFFGMDLTCMSLGGLASVSKRVPSDLSHLIDLKHSHMHVTCNVYLSNVITNSINSAQFSLSGP